MNNKMKAITIKQPFATLIALGLKKFETRSWRTKYRGPLAIHAGKSVDKDAYLAFSKVLAEHGINSIEDLPTGKIIAISNLTECFEVIQDNYETECALIESSNQSTNVNGDEYYYGDYSEGRFAWLLDNVKVLSKPIQVKGQLSIWNWEYDIESLV